MVLDCCYSGAVGGVFAKGGVDDQLQQVSGGRGVYVLAASTAIQAAMEKEGDDYSVFTKHLIEGIETGGADSNGDGQITLDELYDYVHRRVLDEGAQEPMKWSVNVRGNLVIADTGGSPRREKRNRLRVLLLKLASDNVFPDRVLTEAMAHINRRDVAGPTEFDRLLDGLEEGTLAVGEFVGRWFDEGAGPRVPSPPAVPPPAPPAPSPPTPALHPQDDPPTPSAPRTGREDQLRRRGLARVGLGLAFRLGSRRIWIAASAIGGVSAVAWLVSVSVSGPPAPIGVPGVESPLFVDFEEGLLPETYFGNWETTTSEALGLWSLGSPSISDNETAIFQLNPPAGATELAFDYMTDTETCCDHLTVRLDGVPLELSALTSQGVWSTQTYGFQPTGPLSELAWEYQKDGSVSTDRDRIWVDNISFQVGIAGNAGGGFPGQPLPNALGAPGLESVPRLSAPIFVDLESGVLPETYVGDWEITTSEARGLWSLGSPVMTDNEIAFFGVSPPEGATALTFDFLTDTEMCCDHLTVWLDGMPLEPSELVSPGGWSTQTYSFPPTGPLSLVSWECQKDGSVSEGRDRVWVDNISFQFNP